MIQKIFCQMSYGDKYWFKDDIYHREDGPAIEYAEGSKYWYLDGLKHRLDGPAIEYSNGGKEWWMHGQIHREDGPAVEWADGYKEWYLNDVELTEEEFNHWLSKKQLNERLTEQLEVKPTHKRVKI